MPAAAHASTRTATLTINGAGNGHGVGMSQYGAEGYAAHGDGYRQILAHYFSGTSLGRVSPERTVRVLLADGSAAFSGASSVGGVSVSPSSTYEVTATGVGSGLRVATSGGRTVRVFSGAVTATGSGPLQTQGDRYRGSLVFTAAGSGVQTVNAVGLDDYVRGVVAAEMPSSWSPQALAAQAIAARTYAITTSVDGDGYSLYDDTRSQMYGGVGAETAPTNAAVAATSGQVVTYDGRPVTTYFFASSGGHTESIQNVWPGATPEPWLVGVPDPYDDAADDPYFSWTVKMSIASADNRLGSLVKGTLQRVAVTQTGVSPRIVSAKVIGSGGSTTVTGGQLEEAFGLDSTDARFSTTGAGGPGSGTGTTPGTGTGTTPGTGTGTTPVFGSGTATTPGSGTGTTASGGGTGGGAGLG